MKHCIKNMNAVLMHKDIPLYRIRVQDGELVQFYKLQHDPVLTPWEFRDKSLSLFNLNKFVENRIVPDSPQRVPYLLEIFKLSEYTWDGILQHTYGLNTDDYYWFNPVNHPVKYEDIQIRDLYTPEEIQAYRNKLGISFN